MSRIPPVEIEHIPEKLRARAQNPFFQTMAYRPEILEPTMALLKATMRGGSIEPRLKELVAVRVSQVNHCSYCRKTRSALARQLGVSEELLKALYHIDDHRHLFDARELAAIRYAELMTAGAQDISEEVWDELQQHFDDGEIVELSTVIGLFNFFNRFADALQIELPQDR